MPLTPLMEFSVRGGLAILVFHGITNEDAALTLASYSIWFMNLLIPATIGAFLLLINKKRLKRFGVATENQ